MRQLLIYILIGLLLLVIGCSVKSPNSYSLSLDNEKTATLDPDEINQEQLAQEGAGRSEDGGGAKQGKEAATAEAGATPSQLGATAAATGGLAQGSEGFTIEGEATAIEAGVSSLQAGSFSADAELPEPIQKKRQLPEGFVYVDEVLEHAYYEIRYYSDNNFIGERIDGYNAPFAVLSEKAANALLKAEQELANQGYALLIYDAYRPHRAVEQFIEWAADAQDTRMQEQFYPDIDKKQVFELGYLSRRSGHSRGSTIDLTLANLETGEPLDMGSPYDLLGEISAHDAQGLTEEQQQRRALLKETMIAAGFEPYRKEWWHYTLKAEPHPKQYFDFNVE